MRKRWFGLVSLLVGGATQVAQVAEAQGPTPYPPRPGMAPMMSNYQGAYQGAAYPAPYAAPYQTIPNYSTPMASPYGVPYGAYAPATGMVPAMPAVGGGMRPGVAGPMMGGMPGMTGMPASPTVPMYDPAASIGNMGVGGGDDPVFHRPHNETLWLKAEFLLAWITRGRLDAPLVTVGSAADPNPGSLGPANPGTAILFGGSGLDFGILGGIRTEVGAWLDAENCYSADIIGLVLSPTNINYIASSDAAGNPLLARPIINATNGEERSFLTSFPGALSGSTAIDTHSDVWGIEANARRHAYWYEHCHVEALVGFRTLALRERIRIQDNLTDIQGNYLTFNGNPLNAGDKLYEQDLFKVVNQFYGFNMGTGVTFERDWFYLSLLSKVGIGITDQNTVINGFATVNSPGGLGTQTAPGGILAQLSNMGDRTNYVFGVVPEFNASFGLNLHKNVRFVTGYNFLFWNSVIRPGDMIDRVINPGLPPGSPAYGASGPPRPMYVTRETTFAVQTINFGLEFHY